MMLFLPYRPDIGLDQLPFVTILVCLVCLLIYVDQVSNEDKVIAASQEYCQQDKPLMFKLVLESSVGKSDEAACTSVLGYIHTAEDKQLAISQIAYSGDVITGYSKKKSEYYISATLSDQYGAFAILVPPYTTQRLWYEPASWNWKTMISASFAHDSWMHLLGNLFFFFAFAAAVEMIIGHMRFSIVVISLALGTHVFYSLAMLGVENAPPTVGLSGVVMGMMAMFAFFLPAGRIRCLVFFIEFNIPAWLLLGGYVGWNVFELLLDEGQSSINFVTHISGAVIGFTIGMILFRKRRREIAAMVKAQ